MNNTATPEKRMWWRGVGDRKTERESVRQTERDRERDRGRAT